MDEYEFLKQSNLIEEEVSPEALADSIKAWNYLLKKKKLTAENVQHCHKILMKSRSLADNEKGIWRKCRVWIGGREGKPWFAVPQLMDDWIIMANGVEHVALSPDTVEDFIINCHINFEHIHPFVDGNGRMGRLLLNWQRVKIGLEPLIIWNHAKQQYYGWFN